MFVLWQVIEVCTTVCETDDRDDKTNFPNGFNGRYMAAEKGLQT
jgi:hypothetical protein